MKIAIIDDGVNISDLYFEEIEQNLIVDDSLKISRRQDESNKISHGTVCAAIIKKYAKESSIISIKILDEVTRRGNCNKLCKAIEWCLENGINIINLSNGSTYYGDFEKLRKVCNKAFDRGVYITAAKNNNGAFTIPACLPNVLGARCQNEIITRIFFYNRYKRIRMQKNTYDGIEFLVNSIHKLTKRNGEIYFTERCNSFANAYFTACVHNVLKKYEKSGFYGKTTNRFNLIKYNIVGKRFYNKEWCNILRDVSYLTHAYILDMSKNIFTDYLFFDFKYLNSYLEFTKIDDNQFDVIIIFDNYNKTYIKNIQDCIKSKIDNIRSVVLCGAVSNQMRRFLNKNNIMFWCEENYNKLETKKYKKASVPIIYFTGDKKNVIGIINEIKNLFCSDGYYAIKASSYEFSYLYGFYYFSEGKEYYNYLQNIESKYSPDIILVAIDYNRVEIEDDVLIKVNDDLNYEVIVNANEEIYAVDASEVYESILNYYSV
ncbi:S8 family serine peptidase [Clostridium sp. HBUAS56017]|uniref:S8 family serine peptidase n=1 Tax=Clostridium sp. HBUAS56017 TaxID=2571128 RepID=UPI001177AAE4|nr:S8 family serine peptidase [Clostridium sp. HBUAS56017]